MRALKRLRSDYETLLGCTRRMARGDLETEVHEDLGIFEPLHSELDDIRYGFNTAIAEETKSQKMKTELISNVSHDLKTPLTSLISYIDLMKQEPDEAKRQEYLAVLERNSMRLKHLIEDLFEVSKANSGDLKLNVVDVDLVSLISQTLFELAPAIEKAGLTIKTSYSHDKIVLPLDSQKTYRIVENLVSNVTKYSLRGSRVYLTLIERGEEVVLSIRNISQTEIDFDPNDLVERFVRGDKSRNSEGSGLGLAIAKGFAESQHAHFTIQTDGDFFKVIVIFNRRALEDLKPKPAETVKLDMPQAPLIDISKNDENKI
ncbi:MAG: HAMP domain-containing histidine kinase [Holdemania filiformis]|nr:HAMP domain-containing histidine kinase [Holdemania filiformis]